MDLHGKTVLITGAARGIGAETARQLSARGARVALVGLEPEELRRVAAQCGPDAAAFEVDVTDTDALGGVVEAVAEHFGGIDVVMANAGVAPTGFARNMDPAAFERTIEVNLLGVWRTVRAALPHVIERRGYVLVIASLAAASHGPGLAAYSASKAGVEAFADSLRTEIRHLGVDVGVGYYAFLDTDLVRGADANPLFGGVRAQLPGPFGKTYPLGDAVRKTVEGIEERRRVVAFPGWVKPMLWLRGVTGPLADRGADERIAEIDAAFERDVAERGARAASALAGAGGKAAERSETPVG
jgi:NAD(P)-dependent dehydrogenase (short-subunit alcohol dehydrogenase family)